MQIYKTLSGEIIDLDFLPGDHGQAYEEIKNYFDDQPHWNDFANFWMDKITSTVDSEEENLAETVLFKIGQDLESRLGIQQGYVRPADYRDVLRDLIEIEYKSRYQFCKSTGVDEGFLSKILGKKKNLSIAKLEEVLEKIGYEFVIRKKEVVS